MYAARAAMMRTPAVRPAERPAPARTSPAGPLSEPGVLADRALAEICRRFDRDAAAGIDATVDWQVAAGPDGQPRRYRLVIRDGTCTAERGRAHRASVGLVSSLTDLLRLVSGQTRPSRLFLEQRLVVTGDVLLASRLLGLFPASSR